MRELKSTAVGFIVTTGIVLVIAMLIASIATVLGWTQEQSSGSVAGAGVSNPFISIKPAVLGVNALTEPGAGTSALSSIVDTRNVQEATLHYNCTAGTISVNVQTYAEDGTTALALVTPVSATAAATAAMLTIGSESDPVVNTGTISSTAKIRFPQRAIAYSFTNAGGAGTCTARLFLGY